MTEERLKPARPDVGEGKPEYAPRFPWRWVLLGAAALLILGGGYYLREQSKEEALREQIQGVYDQRLGDVVDRYRAFRNEVEAWVMEAHEADPPEEYVDPRLKISALHQGQGLYLRLPAGGAADPESIDYHAQRSAGDAITRCLGIAPINMAGFYEKGAFLMPGWIDRASEENAGMMRLRVIDDELARYTERDLPGILNMMQSQYLLLVLERGETRSTGPVDVFLYDLRNDRKLLSTRTEPEGVLLPVRINVKGAPPAPRVTARTDSPGAADCSIAAQVKELTGEPAMDFRSDMPDPAEGEAEEATEGEGEEPAEAEGGDGPAEGTEDSPEAAAGGEGTEPEAAE